MLSEWEIREHPDFFKDLDKLSKTDLEIFFKKKKKIKENPELLKHLRGGTNCYREPITENIRLI
jgi:mRNA-degrading endonuclease RelE of RelBE toxin-antitoxin system